MTPEPGPTLPDRADRRVIRTALDTTLLVEAAAGTGKTTSMIGRMVELVAAGACPIGEMAAVTFTRKATAELCDRFQVALGRLGPSIARAYTGPRPTECVLAGRYHRRQTPPRSGPHL